MKQLISLMCRKHDSQRWCMQWVLKKPNVQYVVWYLTNQRHWALKERITTDSGSFRIRTMELNVWINQMCTPQVESQSPCSDNFHWFFSTTLTLVYTLVHVQLLKHCKCSIGSLIEYDNSQYSWRNSVTVCNSTPKGIGVDINNVCTQSSSFKPGGLQKSNLFSRTTDTGPTWRQMLNECFTLTRPGCLIW